MFSKIFAKFKGKKQAKILILGLDGAGKTTLLYTMQLGKTVEVFPTVGFNTETASVGNISFTLWDLGGQTHLRAYWRFYLPETTGLIYVVDATDGERLELARTELASLLSEPDLAGVALCVLVNKRDVAGSLDSKTVAERMRLSELCDGSEDKKAAGQNQQRPWAIFDCSAVSEEYPGLAKGLDWLSGNV